MIKFYITQIKLHKIATKNVPIRFREKVEETLKGE